MFYKHILFLTVPSKENAGFGTGSLIYKLQSRITTLKSLIRLFCKILHCLSDPLCTVQYYYQSQRLKHHRICSKQHFQIYPFFNLILVSREFCHLLITIAITLNLNQNRQNVGLDLDPNHLTL